MENGVRGGISGRLSPFCLRSDGLGRSESLALLSAPPLDACPATKTCWVAARTSSSSIEYLLARRNKSSIVVRGFFASDSKNGVPGQMLHLKICRTASMLVLMFCLCRAERKYCPTKASDRSLKLSTELKVVTRLPTIFFRWLGAIQNYLSLPYQMNDFGKVWPSSSVTESVVAGSSSPYGRLTEIVGGAAAVRDHGK
ncbi:hypothetical protein VitviT2T_026618 [Vitis vinifera]|uniref:Uncharacterized protein n=1 Tax=Vitis vinifera TaxID=29760 RepID=A0ABY9DPW7_VITVI|nr:hypothetical protein VitviT2T_026618 [Vitis vinifera]